ncbi:MAG: hypothetical protein HWE22_10630 [Flavobacteriales bacterium]|nr:hypothetical protein [Flavobacteriales bacterium]
MRVLFIILPILFTGCSGIPDVSTPNEEQDYVVATLSKHGISCNFYFHYSSSDQTETNQINKRIDEELLKIADESTLLDMINDVDLIGPRIESNIKDEFDLRNLKVSQIGVEKNILEHFKTKVNVARVKAIAPDEIKHYTSRTELNSQEKSRSADLSLVLTTKHGSEVDIEYAIYYLKQQSSRIPVDSLDRHLKNTIVDSLRQYGMYEMWGTKRDSIQNIMKEIIKNNFPETNRVIILDVVIPEEAKKQFLETDKSRQAIMEALFENSDKLKSLSQELKSNKELSESEIIEIEKEINTLENERVSIKKKGKLLTYDYKP